VHPQPESYWGHVNPVGPRGCYDEAKRFAEAMTMAYHRYHGVDTRIVQDLQHIRAADAAARRPRRVELHRPGAHGEPLTIYGDGSQTRSFCYVSDEVEGIYRLFMNGDSNPTNIGNPNEFTVRQLAELVVELTARSRKSSATPAYRRPQGAPAGHFPRPPDAGLGARSPPARRVQRSIDYFRKVLG
jgi:dTDP-glucose 4,6-dehydratase